MLSGRLKILRNNCKLKQTDMANLMGITVRNYQRYESGDVDLPTSKTVFLADYFNVPLDYLVGRDVSSGCPQPAVTPDEFALVEKIRALPPEKRKLAVDLLNQL